MKFYYALRFNGGMNMWEIVKQFDHGGTQVMFCADTIENVMKAAYLPEVCGYAQIKLTDWIPTY